MSSPAVTIDDASFRLLEALTKPTRRPGFGPHREDYATQEAFDKARGSRVAIEDKL